MIRQISLLIIGAIAFGQAALAQPPAAGHQRQAWDKKMLEAKIDFIAKELELSDAQRSKFETVYRSMTAEVERIHHETRTLQKSVAAKAKPTDLEYEKAAEAMFEVRGRENAVEMRYLQQFKSILTKKQLFGLKVAEHKWMRTLMHHRKDKARK